MVSKTPLKAGKISEIFFFLYVLDVMRLIVTSGCVRSEEMRTTPVYPVAPIIPTLHIVDYLFENWKLARAPFFPYFFLSFALGSLVISPCFFERCPEVRVKLQKGLCYAMTHAQPVPGFRRHKYLLQRRTCRCCPSAQKVY